MANFSLNSVPCTLKSLIISNLEPEDSFKLLKTNRELRHFVLNHGLSPRKIEKLNIDADGIQITNGVMLFDRLWFLLYSGSKNYEFLVAEHRLASNESDSIRITREDLRIFEKMRNVREINLILYNGLGSVNPLKVNLAKSLNEFRFIGNLTIWVNETAQLPMILPRLSLRIEQHFSLTLDTRNRATETLGGSEICEFISNNLTDCNNIDFYQIGRIGKRPSVYAALQKTSFSRLTLNCVWADDFWVAVEEFLNMGAPCQNPEAILVMIGRRNRVETEKLGYSPEIDEFLRGYTVKVDDLDEKRRLMDQWSLDCLVDTITIFRRILAESLQIFYGFRQFPMDVQFCAKVEPILKAIS